MDLAYLSVSPNTLFDALKSRATRSLQQQFFTGTMGRAGDRGYILDRVARQKEKEDLVTDEPADDFYTFFTNGDKYGRSFRISSLSKMGKEVRTEVDAAFRAGLCVPRSVGNLVLKRQISILSSLNALVDGILDAGKGRKAAEMIKALDKLVIGQSEAQPSPSAPSAMAMDHEASLEEHLERLTTEPAVFAHSVNDCYISRPELLPDEKGRMLPATADKYPSWAVFDAVHHAVRSVAIWSYITRLVDHLTSLPDRRCSTRNNDFRLNLVQELAQRLPPRIHPVPIRLPRPRPNRQRPQVLPPPLHPPRPSRPLHHLPQDQAPITPPLQPPPPPRPPPLRTLHHPPPSPRAHPIPHRPPRPDLPPITHHLPLRPRILLPHPPHHNHHPPHRHPPPPPALPLHPPNLHYPPHRPRHRTRLLGPPHLHPPPRRRRHPRLPRAAPQPRRPRLRQDRDRARVPLPGPGRGRAREPRRAAAAAAAVAARAAAEGEGEDEAGGGDGGGVLHSTTAEGGGGGGGGGSQGGDDAG